MSGQGPRCPVPVRGRGRGDARRARPWYRPAPRVPRPTAAGRRAPGRGGDRWRRGGGAGLLAHGEPRRRARSGVAALDAGDLPQRDGAGGPLHAGQHGGLHRPVGAGGAGPVHRHAGSAGRATAARARRGAARRRAGGRAGGPRRVPSARVVLAPGNTGDRPRGGRGASRGRDRRGHCGLVPRRNARDLHGRGGREPAWHAPLPGQRPLHRCAQGLSRWRRDRGAGERDGME